MLYSGTGGLTRVSQAVLPAHRTLPDLLPLRSGLLHHLHTATGTPPVSHQLAHHLSTDLHPGGPYRRGGGGAGKSYLFGCLPHKTSPSAGSLLHLHFAQPTSSSSKPPGQTLLQLFSGQWVSVGDKTAAEIETQECAMLTPKQQCTDEIVYDGVV